MSLHDEFYAWMREEGIDTDKLTRREQARLAAKWAAIDVVHRRHLVLEPVADEHGTAREHRMISYNTTMAELIAERDALAAREQTLRESIPEGWQRSTPLDVLDEMITFAESMPQDYGPMFGRDVAKILRAVRAAVAADAPAPTTMPCPSCRGVGDVHGHRCTRCDGSGDVPPTAEYLARAADASAPEEATTRGDWIPRATDKNPSDAMPSAGHADWRETAEWWQATCEYWRRRALGEPLDAPAPEETQT